MASSSVSQESLDYEDLEVSARRSRIRNLRSRTVSAHKNESIETTGDDKDQDGDTFDMMDRDPPFQPLQNLGIDHESPTRMASRLKDKRGRPNHLHKGKAVKDKRKLREKRRSTGVVHLPATEVKSTGDSLDEDDKEGETRRNTTYNEVIDADNPQTPEEERKFATRRVRNKSPSDLDADLEDNQDYDSTVSQSETNLTMVGQSSPQPAITSKFKICSADGTTIKPTPTAPRREEPPQPTAPVPVTTKEAGNEFHSGKSAFSPRLLERDLRCHPGESSAKAPLHHHHHHVSRDHHPIREKHTTTQKEAIESKLITRSLELERLLEREREEKRTLQDLLEDRDRKISQLEKQIAQMNKDMDLLEEENADLHEESQALIKVISDMNHR